MDIKKCGIDDLDRLAVQSMQAAVDMRQGSPWGDVEESPELLEDERRNMERYLTGGKYEVYEFLVDGEVVGHIAVNLERKYPGVSVEGFFIRREFRRRGYGTQALRTLMEYLGETAIDLDVYCWNERAIAFYRHFGFQEIMLHMNYGT